MIATAIRPQIVPSVSNVFLVDIAAGKNKTAITIRPSTNMVNRDGIPETHEFLEVHFPTALHTLCFNETNLPFHKEVETTEIGHLFEHILLEYLRRQKAAQGYTNIEFNGLTHWDWTGDKRGTFHIIIDIGEGERELLDEALRKSITLLQKILPILSTS